MLNLVSFAAVSPMRKVVLNLLLLTLLEEVGQGAFIPIRVKRMRLQLHHGFQPQKSKGGTSLYVLNVILTYLPVEVLLNMAEHI